MSQQPVYIDGWSNLSAQATFEPTTEATAVMATDHTFLLAQAPDYKKLLPRKQLRRWSRVVRMGLATALQALERAGNPEIHALLSGTAWGCVQDTEKFLEALTANEEQYLTPTAFVQSTHNTVAGQIALYQHNNSYNMTYVQGAISFELALLDACLLLQHDGCQHTLVSGSDELTERLQLLLERIQCATAQRPMGEGAACFVLSRQASAQSVARLLGCRTLYRATVAQQQAALTDLLAPVNYSAEAVKLVLSPQAPSKTDRALFPQAEWVAYEAFCGHYPTQSAFGLGLLVGALDGDAMAQHLLDRETLPPCMAVYQRTQAHWSVVLVDQTLD